MKLYKIECAGGYSDYTDIGDLSGDPSLIKKYKKDRLCKKCHIKLNSYNSGDICLHHELTQNDFGRWGKKKWQT